MSVAVGNLDLPTEALAVIEQSVRDVYPRFDEMHLACDSLREQDRELAAQWLEWICKTGRCPAWHWVGPGSPEPDGYYWVSVEGCEELKRHLPMAVMPYLKSVVAGDDATTFNEPSMAQAYVNLILAGEQSGLTPEQAEQPEEQ